MASEKSPVVPILLLCLIVGAGAVAYIKLAPADVVPREVQVEQQTGGDGVHLLTPYYADHELKFSTEPAKVPKGTDARVFAVNQYLRNTKFVSADAMVKGVTVSNGTADLDFTEAIVGAYGTEDESTVINGILAVMGQFKDVTYVRFLVDGKPIDSLGGNLELTDPLPVTRIPGVESDTSVGKPPKS
jgi:hypothetical protein